MSWYMLMDVGSPEFEAACQQERREYRAEWGKSWIHSPGLGTLTCREEGYEIDLDRCRHATEMLGWIQQVAGKTWATPVMLGRLVMALRDIKGHWGQI